VSLLLSLVACRPVLMSHAEVEITGEFRADGSCEVSAAGRPLFAVKENARTVYVSSSNILLCQPTGAQFDGRRMFMMNFGSSNKTRPQSGTFNIVSNAFRGGSQEIGGAYIDPSRYGFFRPGGGFGITGREMLSLTSGAIEFTRLDSTAVTRPFRLMAVRQWADPR
jgi:hypothetical protein